MKSSIRTMFVMLAIVMSFVLVQSVWAAAEINNFVGTAMSVDNRAIGLDQDYDGITDVTVYHMGPPSYWDSEGVSYPEIGNNLSIDAYDSILNGYIAVSVCFTDQEGKNCNAYIQLRDSDTLKPLWEPIAETTDLSDTTGDGTGDCCPGCPGCDDCVPHEYLSPGPHGNGNNF